MSVITLLTDFGVDDEYVGIMKGVILSLNPAATIVDITHSIDPQDLIQAAYMVESYFKYFPKGTVHVIVVDPGVGSDRAILAFESKGHIFLAPDNGVLTLLFDKKNTGKIVRVDNFDYFLEFVGNTFHGRDIFAPVCAHLSMGLDISRMGAPLDQKDLVRLDIPRPFISNKNDLSGVIVSIDRFGNLITNIDLSIMEAFCRTAKVEKTEIIIGKNSIRGLSAKYDDVKPQKPLAVIGSRGYLEIAVNCGSAREYFSAKKGNIIKVILC